MIRPAIPPRLRGWAHRLRRLIRRVSVRGGGEWLGRLGGGARSDGHTPAVPAIRWFQEREGYAAYVEPTRTARRAREAEICRSRVATGFCTLCRAPRTFTVSGGTMIGPAINLREGLVCRRCGLGNRLRLLFEAVQESGGGPAALRGRRVYLAERLTSFHDRLAERVGELTASEYLDPAYAAGSVHAARGRKVRHEDLCRLSFPDESFDLVVHADVLEHVADHRRALSEMCRVTRRGGSLVFSVPFLHERQEHEVRATRSEDGGVVHLLPAVYHGNPLDPRGSLTFQTYGWDLLDDLRRAGFDQAAVGALAELDLGFASSNSPYADYMEPMILRARRAPA